MVVAPCAGVASGGEEFYWVAASPKIRIVQNWYEEFRDREQ